MRSLVLVATTLACLTPGARAAETRRPSIEAEARLCGHRAHGGGVLDGDSLDVEILRSGGRDDPEPRCAACRAVQRRERDVHGHSQLRLGGGIDAPELRDAGGPEARALLADLLRDAGTLYLDIDDGARGCKQHGHAGRDEHCRLLAVVWVRRGDEWLDVNRALLDWGRTHVPHHDWLRYAGRPSEFGSARGGGAPPTDGGDPEVWIPRSGSRYHRQDCPSLRRGGQAVARSQALGRGLTPCRKCLPP